VSAADEAKERAHAAGLNRRPQRILLYVNPVGGKKKAVRLAARAETLWRACGVAVELLVTHSQGQARTCVREAELRKGDVVVVAGGDGFLAEVVQGLLARPHTAIGAQDVPVATLPAGESEGMVWGGWGEGGGEEEGVGNARDARMYRRRGIGEGVRSWAAIMGETCGRRELSRCGEVEDKLPAAALFSLARSCRML
jgi:hypothetical protein